MSKDINYLITNRGKLEDLKADTSPHTPTANHPKTSPTLNFSRHSAINRTQQILGNASKVTLQIRIFLKIKNSDKLKGDGF
jgi:hypothetical protein